jgi:hypothetical protein
VRVHEPGSNRLLGAVMRRERGTLRVFVTYIFRAESSMSTYSPFGRGRRKFAEKFTSRQGLWLLGIVAVIMMAMMLLIVLGYLNVDID